MKGLITENKIHKVRFRVFLVTLARIRANVSVWCRISKFMHTLGIPPMGPGARGTGTGAALALWLIKHSLSGW